MSAPEKKTSPEERIGTLAGIHGSGIVYADNVVFNAAQGHGFAAEQANHLHDVFTLRDAQHEGTNLALRGADRIVDGVHIQTKYCEDAAKSVAQCFDAQNRFAYWSGDGRPMQIEVPADQYEAAVEAMRIRIHKGQVVLMKDGKVVGAVLDPDEASRIIRKGHYDYATARAIARAGTIEGLCFDTVKGISVARDAAGLSAAISYALAIWRGEDHAAALQAACLTGIKVGGTAWLTSIATAQLGRTSLAQSLVPISHAVVNRMGANVAQQIAALAGKNLSGAAAKSFAAKMGRGNAIAAGVATIVMSSADLFRMFEGRVSFAQVFKTVAINGASAMGGLGGASAGAAQGAAWGSWFPGPGTIIGGIVGGIVGGLAGSTAAESATRFVMDGLIEDDAVEMLAMLQAEFAEQAQVYLLAQPEADQVLGKLEALDLPSRLRDMYAASDRPGHARALLQPILDAVVAARPRVTLPDAQELLQSMEGLLPDASDGAAAGPAARLYNATGSLSFEMPEGWESLIPASGSDSFPTFRVALTGLSVTVTVNDAGSATTPAFLAQNLLKTFLGKDPQRGYVDVAPALIGDRTAYRFSIANTGTSGKQIWTTYYVTRVARYFVYLMVTSKKSTIDADALEAIGDWFSTLQLHRVDATPQQGATTLIDDALDIRMVVPPGWTGESIADDGPDAEAGLLFSLASSFAQVQVYSFGCHAEAYKDITANYLAFLENSNPGARSSVRDEVVNGRPAQVGLVVASVDGKPLHFVLTAVQFEKRVALFTSVLAGDDAWQYYEQCESLAWRLS
jgi:hypothetical protein